MSNIGRILFSIERDELSEKVAEWPRVMPVLQSGSWLVITGVDSGYSLDEG